MKPTHLVPLSAYVDSERERRVSYKSFFYKIAGYSDFIKQPLNLSMFVPTDADGKPLSAPDMDNDEQTGYEYEQELKAYQAAKDKVIFEGWEWSEWDNQIVSKHYTITFSTNRIFLDENVGDNQFVGRVLNSPTYAQLAEATTENPLKLKTK